MTTSSQSSNEKNGSPLTSSVAETSIKIVNSLIPCIKKHVQNDQFDRNDGIDFLDAKNSIMISYMIDLTQLLRLKSSSQVKSSENKSQINECLERLREMKIVLEKVRPLEKKMRYQLDKLLALSASSSAFSAVLDNTSSIERPVDGVGESDRRGESSDPLAFRPNPESMVRKDDKENDSSSDNEMVSNSEDESFDEDDDDELMAARVALNVGRSKKRDSKAEDDADVQSKGLYRAPRLAAVPFMEREKQGDKEERLLKRQRDRMKKSEVLSTLKAAFGDAPEEDDLAGGAALGKQRESSRRFNEQMEEKTRYEEDAMVRLTVSRKEKKMRNKILREEHSNLNSIADLGNIAAGVTAAFGGEKRVKERRSHDKEESAGRHSNGKRRREGSDHGNSKRTNPKNSFQKALYGMEGGVGKRKKSSRK